MSGHPLLDQLEGVEERGDGQFVALCPAHDDHKPSLAVTITPDGTALVKCWAGCATKDVLAAVGLEMRDLFPPSDDSRNDFATTGTGRKVRPAGRSTKPAGREVAAYDYRDATGALLFQTVRFEPKDFRQRVPKQGGGWAYHLNGTQRVLYRTPELAAADPGLWVLLLEGEKDVLAAVAEGFIATCNPMGAGKWSPSYSEQLRGRRVIVIPDNDQPGRKHAEAVAASLAGVAADVRILELSDQPEKGDLSDWLAAGGTAAELRRLIDSAPKPKRHRLNLVCLADVEPEEVEWLWPGRIPLGKQTLLGGDPGVGKSFFACDLGARITTGAEWPDGSGRAPLGKVLYLMCEDGIGDTYRPRLDALGGDVSRVFIIQTAADTTAKGEPTERIISLDRDCHDLDMVLEDHPDIKLLVIDPLQGFLGDVDANANAEVRRVLGPLSRLAEKHRVAVVTIDHLTKQKGNSKALYRTLGSIGLVGNCRAAHLFVKDRDDADRVLMLPTKSNLHRKVPGMAYRIVDGRVEWEDEPVDIDADDALSDKPGPAGDKSDHAKEWVLRRLADGHWHESNKVKDDAMAAGISFATYRRAKEALGVKSEKAGSGNWFIKLRHEHLEHLEQLEHLPGESPGKEVQDAQDAQDIHAGVGEHVPLVGLSGDGWPAEPPHVEGDTAWF